MSSCGFVTLLRSVPSSALTHPLGVCWRALACAGVESLACDFVCLMVMWRAAAGGHRAGKQIKCVLSPQTLSISLLAPFPLSLVFSLHLISSCPRCRFLLSFVFCLPIVCVFFFFSPSLSWASSSLSIFGCKFSLDSFFFSFCSCQSSVLFSAVFQLCSVPVCLSPLSHNISR